MIIAMRKPNRGIPEIVALHALNCMSLKKINATTEVNIGTMVGDQNAYNKLI